MADDYTVLDSTATTLTKAAKDLGSGRKADLALLTDSASVEVLGLVTASPAANTIGDRLKSIVTQLLANAISTFTDPIGSTITQTTTLKKYFSDDFGGAALSATNWDVLDGGQAANAFSFTQGAIGTGITGITHSVAGSVLSIVMGTTANAEKWLMSKAQFCCTEDIAIVLSRSQPLAANSLRIGLVEVDPTTGAALLNPNLAANFTNAGMMEYGQTTNTAGAGLVAIADSSSAETTISPATAFAPASMVTAFDTILQVRAEDIHAHSGLTDSAAVRTTNSQRLSSQVPNDQRVYKLLIRARNIGTPGSSTTFAISRVLVQDHEAMAVALTEAPGTQNGSQGLPVNATLVGTAGVVNPSVGTGTSTTLLGSSATYTGTAQIINGNVASAWFAAMAYADQAGTLNIQASFNSGTTFETVASVNVTAALGGYLKIPLVGFAGVHQYRIQYVNGASAQGAFGVTGGITAA